MNENYYIVLGIDPETKDWETIEKKITGKARAWAQAKTGGAPKLKKDAERWLKEIDRMKRALKDPDERDRIRCQAASQLREGKDRELRERKERQLTNLRDNLRALTNEWVPREWIQKLVADPDFPLSEKEIVATVEECGKRVGDGSDSQGMPRKSRETLERSEAKNIRFLLEQIGSKDLYEFLSMPRESDPGGLMDQANRILGTYQSRGPVDPKAGTRTKLAGRCMVIFAHGAAKERYDNTLTDEILEESDFDNAVTIAVSGGNRIEGQQVRELVNLAGDKGVARELAIAYLHEFADKQGWTCAPFDAGTRTSDGGGGGYPFFGRRYGSESELARAFMANWDNALLDRKSVEELVWWLRHDRGNERAADWIREVAGDGLADGESSGSHRQLDDLEVFDVIRALDPDSPYVFKDVRLSTDNIVSLAENSLKQPKSSYADDLYLLYSSRILEHLGDSPRHARHEPLTEVWLAWTSGVSEYKHKHPSGVTMSLDASSEGGDRVTVAMILAVVTPGCRVVDEIRKHAKSVRSTQALETEWYGNLGDPGRCTAVEALLMCWLADRAATEAKDSLVRKVAGMEREKYTCKPGAVEIYGMGGAVIGILLGWAWWGVSEWWSEVRAADFDERDWLYVLALLVVPFCVTYLLASIRYAAHNGKVDKRKKRLERKVEKFE